MISSYEGAEPFIYVCYSHQDFEKVLPIIGDMLNQGYRLWWDADIRAGESWTNIIAEHISRCTVFMCFISHSSVESLHVETELHFASKERKSILPIFLEDVKLPNNFIFIFILTPVSKI